MFRLFTFSPATGLMVAGPEFDNQTNAVAFARLNVGARWEVRDGSRVIRCGTGKKEETL